MPLHQKNIRKLCYAAVSSQLNDKLELLNKYFPQDLKGKTLTPGQIDFHFKKRIRKQTKDLLEDIKDVKS